MKSAQQQTPERTGGNVFQLSVEWTDQVDYVGGGSKIAPVSFDRPIRFPLPALHFDHLQPTEQAVRRLWPDAASRLVVQS